MRKSIAVLVMCFGASLCSFAQVGNRVSWHAAADDPFLDLSHQRTTNQWQQTIRTPEPIPKDPAERVLRTARDAYAEKVFSDRVPIEQAHGSSKWRQERWIEPGGQPAVPVPYDHELVIVGSFESFDTVLSTSHESIYSEVHVRVDRVLYSYSSPESALPGSLVDVLLSGGTVQLPDGSVLSFDTDPHPFGLTPGSTYVLFLRYVEKGSFYLLMRSILLENGKAMPNSPDDVIAANKGVWPFSNLSESAVIAKIQAALQQQRHP